MILSWLASIEKDPLANFHSLAGNHFVNKVAHVTGLTTLPQHLHEIILFGGIYFVLFASVSLIAPIVYPRYKELSPRTQHGFDTHVVSHVNAILMCVMSFPLFFSTKLDSLSSYTPYSGLVVANNIGYFLWDVWVTVTYFKYEGISFFAHAITALYVFVQALRPFMLNVAAPFLWFEASTPFVNVNWYAAHVPGMVSERTKQLNGLALIFVFFCCRIVSGPFYGYRMFKEAFTTPPPNVPLTSVAGVLLCYLTLVTLNFVWFSKMIKILMKTIKALRKPAAEPTAKPTAKKD